MGGFRELHFDDQRNVCVQPTTRSSAFANLLDHLSVALLQHGLWLRYWVHGLYGLYQPPTQTVYIKEKWVGGANIRFSVTQTEFL